MGANNRRPPGWGGLVCVCVGGGCLRAGPGGWGEAVEPVQACLAAEDPPTHPPTHIHLSGGQAETYTHTHTCHFSCTCVMLCRSNNLFLGGARPTLDLCATGTRWTFNIC